MTNKLILPVESRMQGDLHVRFGGRPWETYHRKVARRPLPSLHAKGEQAIQGYTFTGGVHSVCLNDLGIELESKQQHYGTDLRSVVEEFLMARYELYQSKGSMCHVTTNLDLDKLSTEYPPRLVDRLKQYNFIFWRGSSKR